MAIQRNVDQQNQTTLAEIKWAAAMAPSLAWLPGLIDAQALPREGALVGLSIIPEQEGDWYRCVWLTTTGRFWKFTAVVSRQTTELLAVEDVFDITDSIPTTAQMPGTGKSFGHLAKQFLHDMDLS